MRCAHLLLATAACFAGPLPAHGGMYRGPPPFPAVPPPAGGPLDPGLIGTPAGPRTGGPVTGGRPLVSDDTSWQAWWEFNKDPFLQLRAGAPKGPMTGSDEFFLGPRREVLAHDALQPTNLDRRERIAPALVKLLRDDPHRDMVTACLVGLAKLGVDTPEIELRQLYATWLKRGDQEVRETAALAFGIDGRSGGLASLLALLRDDAEGRRLVDGQRVPERTRAFAAYGLGLLAHRSSDPVLQQQVHDALVPLLNGEGGRELRVGAVSALGLLALDPARARNKRLSWSALAALWRFYDADLGRGDELLQAHVPAAVARLLGRGNGPEHVAARTKLLAELSGQSKRSASIQRAAALALGALAMPDDAAVQQGLVQYWQHGNDQQARRFAVMALGRIGGAACREALLKIHLGANKSTERPWVALALGVVAFQARKDGGFDQTVARLLLDDLVEQQNKDLRAASAVALGLSGARDAGDRVVELLLKHENEETLAGYLCVCLALLDYREAVPALTAVVQRSVRQPFLLLQSTQALGRLSDTTAGPVLRQLMRDAVSTAELAALAQALGKIGDRRSIDELQRMAGDKQLSSLARSFAAAALGGVGDKDQMAWNVCLAIDVNYAAAVETLTDGSMGVLDIL